MIDETWVEPDQWRAPAPSRHVPLIIAAGAFVGVVAALVLIGVVIVRSSPGRPQPFSSAEQGPRIPVEQGVAPDGRHYSFEVSRGRAGAVCSFLQLQTPVGSPGNGPVAVSVGGGSCGSPDPIGLSFGSGRDVVGITQSRITAVDLTTPDGVTSIPTKALPAGFANRRYFVTVLPPGTELLKASARTSDGSVIWRRSFRS